ncbi:hypothetical protein [Pedobacter endophyticus]|uniref:Uncharacterized protein n=1 Tax=Pedobacter endophyticus TaxID=2789740 RepID=A0A7S9L1J9_9SPHI|nr:hypothetical protein [Pedobacter endophyticus]QPH40815.1 hypothetical protein IZT61_05995 [Pedobacter endophyticus]
MRDWQAAFKQSSFYHPLVETDGKCTLQTDGNEGLASCISNNQTFIIRRLKPTANAHLKPTARGIGKLHLDNQTFIIRWLKPTANAHFKPRTMRDWRAAFKQSNFYYPSVETDGKCTLETDDNEGLASCISTNQTFIIRRLKPTAMHT